jgi:acyl-CoA thioesterase FadM
MPRIKISLPQKFNFTTTIGIRITDLNYGGHVGNDTVLSLIHEARMQFLQHFNYTELEFAGISLIMSDVAIEFKNEVFYGDVLTALVTANHFTSVLFDLFYKLIKTIENKEIVVALAKTGMVCFNYSNRKVVALPHGIKELFNQ